MQTDVHRYMSEPWLAMIETQAQRILDAHRLHRKPFSLAEWLTDTVPPSDGPRQHRGFRLDIADGVARVRAMSAPERADVTVEFPYALGYRLSKLPSGPAFTALVAESMTAGLVRLAGDPSLSPFPEHALHDAIVPRTL